MKNSCMKMGNKLFDLGPMADKVLYSHYNTIPTGGHILPECDIMPIDIEAGIDTKIPEFFN